MECVEGKIMILQNGRLSRYDNREQVLLPGVDSHEVEYASVQGNCECVELLNYKVNPLVVFS